VTVPQGYSLAIELLLHGCALIFSGAHHLKKPATQGGLTRTLTETRGVELAVGMNITVRTNFLKVGIGHNPLCE